MLHLKLKKNNTWHTIDLAPDQVIVCEDNYDILGLELEAADKTYPFNIPDTATNRRFFGALLSTNSRYNAFQEYEAILSHRSNFRRTGIFRLTEIQKGYQGFMKAKASVLAKVKNKLIGEVIGGAMVRVQQTVAQLNGVNENSPVVFPVMLWPNFYKTEENELGRSPHNASATFKFLSLVNHRYADYSSSKTFVLPVPRLLTVIEQLLQAVGFEAQFNFQVEDFFRVVLLTHQMADNPWQWNPTTGYNNTEDAGIFADILYRDTLPAITVSEFLKALRVSFGMKFTWKENGVCELDLVRDLLRSRKQADITPYVQPDGLRQEESNQLVFAFDGAGDGDPLAELKVKTSVLYRHQLPAPDMLMLKDARLVLTENCYYTVKQEGFVYKWAKTGMLYHDSDEGDNKLETKLRPLTMVNEVELIMMVNLQKYTISVSRKAFEIVSPVLERAMMFVKGDDPAWVDQVKILEPSESASEYADIILFDNKLLFEPKNKDGQTIEPDPINMLSYKVQLKKRFPFMVPLLEEGGSSNVTELRNDKFPAYMGLYHGKTPWLGKEGLTNQVSSSNFDSAGNKLAPFALRYTGEDNLVEHFWEEPLQLLSDTEKLKVSAVLPPDFLLSYDGRTKLRIKDATYLPILIRYELTQNGIRNGSLELRQLKHAKQVAVHTPQGAVWKADTENRVMSETTDGRLIIVK